MISGIFLKLLQRDPDIMVMGWADGVADISEQSEQGEELRSHLSQFCVTGDLFFCSRANLCRGLKQSFKYP